MARVDFRNRRAGVAKLPDGRLRVSRMADVQSEVRGDAKLDAEVWLDWGTPDEEHTDCRLIAQELAPLNNTAQAGARGLTRIYEELPESAEVQVGKLRIVTGEDGREFVQAQFIQFSTGTYNRGTIGTDEPPGYTAGDAVLSRVEATDDGTLRRITRLYVKASSTPFQLGDAVASIADPRAFVGTTAGGALTGSTRFAREWTVRYVVKGDASVGDGNWHAVNSTLAFGARTGYLTATRIERQGIAYSVIARIYNELPGKLVYDRPTRYPFPGTLGLNNGVPYAIPGATRQVPMEIEETYHVGEVAAQALEFEVLSWAAGTVNFETEDGDGSKSFSFPGCLGSLSISATDKLFAGYFCDVLAGVIESDPNDYPSGKKRIASDTRPWKGDIWKRTNAYITF